MTTYPIVKCRWNVTEGPLGGEERVLLQARCEVENALVGITQVQDAHMLCVSPHTTARQLHWTFFPSRSYHRIGNITTGCSIQN